MQEKGLNNSEAEKKLKQNGYNEIKDIGKISLIKILLRQIKNNFVVYLLLIAMIISFFVGKNVTGYAILGVIILVITTGFIQEYKAEKAVSELKKMIMPVSIVIRNGKEQEIPSREIVEGDILILRTGERIPADCIVVKETDLLLDESILTGESREIKKISVKSSENYKEENVLFMGSFIINGKCTAKVIKTGMETKFGKIARLISITEKELPLQDKTNKIAKVMATIAVIMSVITGFVILILSTPFSKEVLVDVLIVTIALAVSAFPEGFPVVLITTLSLGAYRMAKKNAIVNRMSIIETLGETTIICSDKTGTITKGEMTIREVYAGYRNYSITGIGYETKGDFLLNNKKIEVEKEKILNLLLKTAAICNEAKITKISEEDTYHAIGTPTESALLIMAGKGKVFQENLKFEIEEENTFSSERKMMSVLAKEGKERNVYSKGAFEVLIDKCKFIQKENGIFKLLKKDKERLFEMNKKMTSKGLRVVALAYKKTKKIEKGYLERDLIFLGMTGMEDPPREEIKNALELCKKAGIKVKMITGDHKDTAIAIAKQIGFDSGRVMEGKELDKITDSQLVKIVNSVVIFARVRPEHKIRIVKALKENKEIVTMTGDGVNDAPALKEAHIGVAMGKNGTDVSRSVADLTLKDDNFATIVDAIKEGRTIFRNMRKFVTYQLSCNYAELSILFFGVLLSPFLGWQIPLLLALQILFMNLVTDDLPAITLGFNPSSPDIMEESSRKKSEILDKNLFILIVAVGMTMAILTLLVYLFVFNIRGESMEYARTSALASLIFLEIAGAFNFRSFRKGVLNRSPFVNKYLVYASIISVLATLAIIYTPLSTVFGTVHIGLVDWSIAISSAIILIIIFDILKYQNNKSHFWKE